MSGTCSVVQAEAIRYDARSLVNAARALMDRHGARGGHRPAGRRIRARHRGKLVVTRATRTHASHVRRRVRARASPLLRAAGAEQWLARAQARPGTGSGNGREGGVERRPASHGSTSQRARASARAPALFDVCVSLSWPVLSNACPLRGQPCSGPRRPPTAGRFGSEPEARDRGGGRQQCLARKRLPFPWKHQRS